MAPLSCPDDALSNSIFVLEWNETKLFLTEYSVKLFCAIIEREFKTSEIKNNPIYNLAESIM
jgi:hypothetical protein